MAVVTIVYCCLCHHQLMEGAALKKRKRFHGDSCQNTREVVSKITEEQQQSLASFVETNNPDAFLCHVCDTQVVKYSKLLKEAQKVKDALAEKLSKLTRLSGNNRGQKRVTELHEQSAKRTCPIAGGETEGNLIQPCVDQPCIDVIGDANVVS